jgi:hypothetical protein
MCCEAGCHLVVISTRSQLLVIERPAQPTDLLLVTDQLSQIRFSTSHIPLEYQSVPAARGQNVCVPRHGTNTRRVPTGRKYADQNRDTLSDNGGKNRTPSRGFSCNGRHPKFELHQGLCQQRDALLFGSMTPKLRSRLVLNRTIL